MHQRARRSAQPLGLTVKVAAATLLLLITFPLSAAEEDKTYVGKVLAVSIDRIELDQTESTVLIGFVVDPDAIRPLEKIKVGDEVRAVFGVASHSDGRSINKLVSIRICTPKDEECAADRRTQDKEREEWAKRYAASMQERDRCRLAMEVLLANDSRYAPATDIPALPEVISQYDALSGEQRACASDVVRQHQNAVLDACELYHCGDNVGGGCSHIAGHNTTTGAIVKAIEKCGR